MLVIAKHFVLLQAANFHKLLYSTVIAKPYTLSLSISCDLQDMVDQYLVSVGGRKAIAPVIDLTLAQQVRTHRPDLPTVPANLVRSLAAQES